ncbi:MAG: ASKHA domain-containing protein, partial [Dehalococcoidales bacterium]|nr:ASKHA domain-containing protein [Dehalococcoidales bacterium]
MSKGLGQVKVVFQPSERRGDIGSGKSIRQAAHELGVGIEGLCGGEGSCGKCRVRIEEGIFPWYGIESRMDNLSPLTKTEKKLLTSRQQLDGYRLACQARIRGDVIVSVPEECRQVNQIVLKTAGEIAFELKPAVRKYCVELKPATLDDSLGDWERLQAELKKRFKLVNLAIDYQVLRSLQRMVRQGNWRITVSLWMGREVIGVEPGVVENSYVLAVDIGTTTVAAYLCRMSTGDVIATDSMVNPQVAYGEDVIARINYAMACKEGLEVMNRAIIRGINELAGKTAVRAGIRRSAIVDMAVVGNTCMHHIFLGLDPRYLGQSPFPPALHRSLDIKARELGLRISPGAYVHVLPVEAGFVGADNVGVLIAEEPYHQDSMVLIIDVGTNGELIMGNRDRLVSASCATGPAFEGAGIRYGVRAAPGAIEKVAIDPGTCEVR